MHLCIDELRRLTSGFARKLGAISLLAPMGGRYKAGGMSRYWSICFLVKSWAGQSTITWELRFTWRPCKWPFGAVSPRQVSFGSRQPIYKSEYRWLLAIMGMEQSMSRKDNCWDNAPADRFFRSLKHETAQLRKIENQRSVGIEHNRLVGFL